MGHILFSFCVFIRWLCTVNKCQIPYQNQLYQSRTLTHDLTPAHINSRRTSKQRRGQMNRKIQIQTAKQRYQAQQRYQAKET